MPKPQQPELRRSGYGATSDDSAKIKAATAEEKAATKGTDGPIPEDNRPGHHPEHEQDKPDLEAFAEAQGGDVTEE
jgi:hypothetical protein